MKLYEFIIIIESINAMQKVDKKTKKELIKLITEKECKNDSWI